MAAGGIGSQLSQPPVSLINTANAFTKKYFAPTIADAILLPSPTLWRMTRKGNKIKGGGAIVWPVLSQEELTGGAYYGAQTLDTSAVDSVQPAELQWKFYYQSIVIPYTDYLLNQGAGESVDLVRGKEQIAMGSLLQKLARGWYGVSPQNTANDIDSVNEALASSGTYAGITINPTFWKCNGGAGPTSGGSISNTALQTFYGQMIYGNEEPDTLITTQAGWNSIWGIFQNLQRFIYDEETTRIGFKSHFMVNNAVLLHDQFVPAGQMIGITSKYAEMLFNPQDYFTVAPFIRPTNQRVIVSQIFVQLNMQFKTLRQHGSWTGISNA